MFANLHFNTTIFTPKTTERKEFPGQNQSATQNLTDLRFFILSFPFYNTCISQSETMFILTQNCKKKLATTLKKVFDCHCRILILTCTVDFGNNGPNCNVSLLIKGFTNSLLLVAYFLSPCKIIFIYILIETFKMYYIVKTNHFQ